MNEPETIQYPARRRLAKGALAGTAVLASITSKNALGASYACTVSGQQSGNLSRAGETVNCQQDGFKSLPTLRNEYAGGRNKKLPAPDAFGVKYLDPAYSAPGNKKPVPMPDPATFNQVFSGANGLQFSKGGDLVLAQAALVVYVNAARSDYHVTQTRCKELYDGALGAGMSLKGSTTGWDAIRCADYLKMLAGLA